MKSIQSSRKEFVVKFKIIIFVLRKSLLGYELSVIILSILKEKSYEIFIICDY